MGPAEATVHGTKRLHCYADNSSYIQQGPCIPCLLQQTRQIDILCGSVVQIMVVRRNEVSCIVSDTLTKRPQQQATCHEVGGHVLCMLEVRLKHGQKLLG